MQGIQGMAESYTLISPLNFMGGNWVSFVDVMDSLPAHLRENHNGPRMIFDAMRARYLSEHFDHVYVDVDVELIQPIPILDLPQKAGPGVLVGNGQRDWGWDAWAAYLRMCPKFCRPASLMFHGVPHVEVPEKYYIHHYANGRY